MLWYILCTATRYSVSTIQKYDVMCRGRNPNLYARIMKKSIFSLRIASMSV
jgi:hypothetical protein